MRVWGAPVRYAECDQQGIAFNAHYLAWCDEAATAWFGVVGTPYEDLLTRGLDMRVKATTLEWSAPVRWRDALDVDAAVERVGGSSWVLAMRLCVREQVRCTVRTTYVLVDDRGRPNRVPDDLRAAWTGTRAASA